MVPDNFAEAFRAMHAHAYKVNPRDTSRVRDDLLDYSTRLVQEGYTTYVRNMHADSVRGALCRSASPERFAGAPRQSARRDGVEARGRDDAPQRESTVRSHVAPPRAILRADRLLALPSISDEDASRQLCCGQAGGEARCARVRVAPACDAESPHTRTVQASGSSSGSPSLGQVLQLLQPPHDDAAARRRATGCLAARGRTDGATAKSTAIIHALGRRRICSPLGDSPQAWGTPAQATRGTVLLSPYVCGAPPTARA